MRDFGCKGKSLISSQNLFLARAFNSCNEGDSIFLLMEDVFQPLKRKMVQTQTEFTPFRSSPLLEEFGYCGENYENIQSVLDGTYKSLQGIDSYAIEFIRELEMPDSIRAKGPIDINLTEAENKQAWMCQKGGTASDGSTLSFEHYKTACLDSDLNEVDTLLRNLPLLFGFAPPSWLSITDVEILEKLGIYDIEQMLAVQLFAAEFNTTNKMIGKRALA
jgi:hypothetical protein